MGAALFLSSLLFLQKEEKRGNETLGFQRPELVHRFVTDMVSGFSISAFLLQLFKDREITLCLGGFQAAW